MTPRSLVRPLALVTGASGGIGAAIAVELAGAGHDLLLVARGTEAMESLGTDLQLRHGVDYRVVGMDLAEHDAVDRLVAALEEAGSEVDVLVNNAGFADYGEFAGSDPAKQREMLAVNVMALTLLTRALLPGMLQRGRGRVLNVASTAAFLPGPMMSVYFASKAYVLSFSEALAEEVRGTGVTVTTLCPGPVATGFQERAEMQDSKLLRQSTNPMMDAESVARAGVAGMQRGAGVVLPGAVNKITARVPRLLPRRVLTRAMKRAQARVS
jgi:short-subunit dehydrogenase